MKLFRSRYLWLALPLAIGLWLVWPHAPNKDGGPRENGGKPSTRAGAVGTTTTPDSTTDGPRRPSRVREHVVTPATSAKVDRILADDAISPADAAVMLRDFAADASLPEGDRIEALTHGLNLDIGPFAHFAELPGLSADLATTFLEAVINHNESPELQIQSYMALLKHPDAEVAKSATDMLAFMVDDDAREADIPTLILLGTQKLANIRSSSHP